MSGAISIKSSNSSGSQLQKQLQATGLVYISSDDERREGPGAAIDESTQQQQRRGLRSKKPNPDAAISNSSDSRRTTPAYGQTPDGNGLVTDDIGADQLALARKFSSATKLLKEMITCGFLRPGIESLVTSVGRQSFDRRLRLPGRNVLMLEYYGNKMYADMDSEGNLYYQDQKFTSPTGLATFIKKQINPGPLPLRRRVIA